MVSPWLMDLLVASMACWMTLLPAVREVISRPCRMGTPEPIRVPRVRVKRATPDLRITLPRMGMRRAALSVTTRPLVVAR